MKSLLLLGLLFINFAHAAVLEVGTYSGQDSQRNDFKFHVQEITGRTGSFMGILMSKTQARVYLLDQFSTNKYGMMAMRPMDNYVIGVMSTDPVMALTATDDTIVITPNHSTVDIAYETSITFKKKSKKALRWNALRPDNYASRKLVISALDVNDEAAVTSKVDGMAGDYILRESRPNLFLMLESQLVSTGVKLNRAVKNFVFFQNNDEIVVVEGETGFFKVYEN